MPHRLLFIHGFIKLLTQRLITQRTDEAFHQVNKNTGRKRIDINKTLWFFFPVPDQLPVFFIALAGQGWGTWSLKSADLFGTDSALRRSGPILPRQLEVLNIVLVDLIKRRVSVATRRSGILLGANTPNRIELAGPALTGPGALTPGHRRRLRDLGAADGYDQQDSHEDGEARTSLQFSRRRLDHDFPPTFRSSLAEACLPGQEGWGYGVVAAIRPRRSWK